MITPVVCDSYGIVHRLHPAHTPLTPRFGIAENPHKTSIYTPMTLISPILFGKVSQKSVLYPREQF